MFSSLASFIFGSNTSATTQSETNQNPPTTPAKQEEYPPSDEDAARIDAENTIQVTRSTPSVTGTPRNLIAHPQGKRGKNRRNRRQFKRPALEQQGKATPPPPSITKLLTPSESFEEDDFDEDDWFIVEREDEDTSLPRTDSEEELSAVEVKPKVAAESNAVPVVAPSSPNGTNYNINTTNNNNNNNNSNSNPVLEQRRQLQHIHSHSLFSGPRPQQNRNLLQRARNSGARGGVFNVATLSPPRSISSSVSNAGVAAIVAPTGLADGGLTQSLYVVSSAARQSEAGYTSDSSEYGNGANVLMEESWFVTPPPCFASIGPIHMETSPFENLLIEHPSMSVYHSIRSAQEATDSFVNLDLGVEESQQQPQPVARVHNGRNNQAAQHRSASVRIDRYSAAQIKQELLARNGQKVHDKKERQNICRGAVKRANKVRDYQSKGNRQRRSDMQHCKINSGANNNRKCYF